MLRRRSALFACKQLWNKKHTSSQVHTARRMGVKSCCASRKSRPKRFGASNREDEASLATRAAQLGRFACGRCGTPALGNRDQQAQGRSGWFCSPYTSVSNACEAARRLRDVLQASFFF